MNDQLDNDGTDYAHPVGWRGHTRGVEGVCDIINNILDNKMATNGIFTSPKLEALKKRIREFLPTYEDSSIS